MNSRVVAVVIAVAALTSGCGSSAKPAAAARSGYEQSLKYAECMRTHGVASFPDPSASANGGGHLIIHAGPGTGIDPSAPAFVSAQQACGKLLPKGAPGPGGAIPVATKEQALKFSACMRSHGVPGFPDPGFSGNSARLELTHGSGVNPAAPAFKAAQKACGSPLPGGVVNGSGAVGGPS